jgi:hypothetical protein
MTNPQLSKENFKCKQIFAAIMMILWVHCCTRQYNRAPLLWTPVTMELELP